MPAVMNSMSQAFDEFDDAITILHGGLPAHLGIRARAQSLGDVAADLQGGAHLAVLERLRIGIDANKIHTFEAGLHHVCDCVAARRRRPRSL